MHRDAIRHLKRADPKLAQVIAHVGGCRFAARAEGTHFDALLRSIIYQQLSGKAAATIHARFAGLFGGRAPTPEELLATSDEALRGVGLSRQKLSYLKDLARHVATGELPLDGIESLSDEEIMDALVRVKGIGRWTAQMFLMFRLGRTNVLPDLDLGIQKGIKVAYRMRKLPPPARVQQIGARWAPYATIASWYLWRLLDDLDGFTPAPR
jgi:DNA-3-methyladenine glycosylase II